MNVEINHIHLFTKFGRGKCLKNYPISVKFSDQFRLIHNQSFFLLKPQNALDCGPYLGDGPTISLPLLRVYVAKKTTYLPDVQIGVNLTAVVDVRQEQTDMPYKGE